MLPRFILLLIVIPIYFSCNKPDDGTLTVAGMKPIYVSEADFYDIKNESARKVENTGGIYIWKQYFLIAEYRKGIHVYDRTNPSLPMYITFLNIPGCADFTIAENTLFADNGFDILSINIVDINKISVNKVIKNATKNSRDLPPNYIGYFECHDPSKGYYIGWDSTVLYNPKCRKFQ